MITRETDYALRTALYLAKQSNGKDVVSTASLAEAMSIPYRFLRKIVSKLVSSGLVESRRGKGGGLMLSRSARDISLLHIINAVDLESVLLNRCTGEVADCDRSPFCGIRHELTKMQQQLNVGLSSVTLEVIAKREKE